MRKNVIALSIAALVGGLGMAGGASAAVWEDLGGATPTDGLAFVVQPAGTGHILVVPYFNTQGTNATLLNITNTDTVNGKAMKIRFRGGANSDDIFDFQLYLSPGDVWTANIAADANGASRMLTNDKSCTLPPVINQSFVLDRLPTQFTTGEKNAWTREGYIEILNMADVPPNAIDPATGAALAGANALFTATKHVSGVAPCTAATMNTLLTDPATLAAARTQGFRSPSGGVFANYMIVDVANSGSYSGEATAISAVVGFDPVTLQPLPGRGNIVFFPQTGSNATTPDAHTADPTLRTVFGAGNTDVQNGSGGAYSNGALPSPIIVAAQFDLPDLSTPYLALGAPPTPVDPIQQAAFLTDALSTMAIRNEYFTDPTVNAVTDWAFSMPTRRYHVALDYRTATPVRAFTNYILNWPWEYFNASNTTVGADKKVCVTSAGMTVWDREEGTVTSGFVISPGTSSVFQLCGETTVLSFNAGSATAQSALGGAVARSDIATPKRDGWASIATPGLGVGLPIAGKAFMRAAVPAGKFGLTFEHRYTR